MKKTLLVSVIATLFASYIHAEVTPKALRLMSARRSVALEDLALPAADIGAEVRNTAVETRGMVAFHTVIHATRLVPMRLVMINADAVVVMDMVAALPTTFHVIAVTDRDSQLRVYWAETRTPGGGGCRRKEHERRGGGPANTVLCGQRVSYH